jgi:hypothetical protein
MVEDRLLWTRISRLAPIYFIQEVLALYRFGAESFTSRLTRSSMRDREWEYIMTLTEVSGGADSAISKQAARVINNSLSACEVGRAKRLEMIASALHRVLADPRFGFSGKLSVLMRLTLEALPLALVQTGRNRAGPCMNRIARRMRAEDRDQA